LYAKHLKAGGEPGNLDIHISDADATTRLFEPRVKVKWLGDPECNPLEVRVQDVQHIVHFICNNYGWYA